MSEPQRWWVREVHNFGGFFGGDTVTLTATPWPASDEETTLVIDEKALTNVADRHTIAPEMLLALNFAGDRVERAELLGARAWETWYAATGSAPPVAPLQTASIRAYHCPACDLWIGGAPVAGQCAVCSSPISDLPISNPSV